MLCQNVWKVVKPKIHCVRNDGYSPYLRLDCDEVPAFWMEVYIHDIVDIEKSKRQKGSSNIHSTFDSTVRQSLERREGVLINMAGEVSLVKGPFKGELLESLLCTNGSRYFQMVPCTVGKWKDMYEIWCDDEAMMFNVGINTLATDLLGEQVYGGLLRGPVLFVRNGIVD